jgi:hypothetical protein
MVPSTPSNGMQNLPQAQAQTPRQSADDKIFCEILSNPKASAQQHPAPTAPTAPTAPRHAHPAPTVSGYCTPPRSRTITCPPPPLRKKSRNDREERPHTAMAQAAGSEGRYRVSRGQSGGLSRDSEDAQTSAHQPSASVYGSPYGTRHAADPSDFPTYTTYTTYSTPLRSQTTTCPPLRRDQSPLRDDIDVQPSTYGSCGTNLASLFEAAW